jgi:hypothetical protein
MFDLTDAETQLAGSLLERYQCQLLERFPDRGIHVFIHAVFLSAAELFCRLEDEESLCAILNACLGRVDGISAMHFWWILESGFVRINA